jgi:hypothetical protein
MLSLTFQPLLHNMFLPMFTTVPVDSENEGLFYHPEYASYVFTPSCQDKVTKSTLQNLYIEYLNGTSGFSSFCTTYGNECVKENVDVEC